MKSWQPISVALLAGCFLAWLGVNVSGVSSAVPWPPSVIALSKSNPTLAHYVWTVGVHFTPLFTICLLSGLVLFRFVGKSVAALAASLAPDALLYWIMGPSPILLHPPNFALFGIVIIAVSSLPLGLVVAWLLTKRRPLALPSSGRPPAGFAV